jgi:hypothetical protein
VIVFTIIDKNGNVETLKTSRTRLTVGGAYTDDITLLGGDISPEHGVFEMTGEAVVYTDKGFGTLINDRKIVGETVPLSPNDVVRIGSDTITYALDRKEVVTSDDIPFFEADFMGKESLHSPEPTRPTSPAFSTPSDDTEPSRSSDSTPSEDSSSPDSKPFLILPENLPEFIQVRLPEPTDKNKKEYIIGAVVLVLMGLFWPIGFVANLLAWGYMSKDEQYDEERPLFHGCAGMLLFINLVILGLFLLKFFVRAFF